MENTNISKVKEQLREKTRAMQEREKELQSSHVERGGKQELPGVSQEEEEANLDAIIAIAQNNLDKARKGIQEMDQDIADLFESLESSDREGMVLWNDATLRLKDMKRGIDRLEKARKKPYFGRIDFQDPSVAYPEAYYIGRVGIAKTPSEPVVIDWRAPIASVYYENSLGPCQYTVSSEGNYEIDLTRKRTYEIEKDCLKDFFDSDVVANDDLLTKYLAKNKKAVLGEIIATIQKEQNLIIRRSPRTNIIVQGCAGSGKTTVAMHRISYILYNFEDDFRPEDFYIVGSNQILLNYITSVLPDLDVYGVSQMTMEQLFVRLLYEDWDKLHHKIRPLDKNDEINCKKGNMDWFRRLEDFCWRYEEKYISRADIYMDKTNAFLMGKALIDNYCRDNPMMSMQSKCLMLNEILMSKYENEIQGKHVSVSSREKKAMEKKYSVYFGKDEWKGSIFELYKEFLLEQIEKGEELEVPEDSFDVYDLAAMAYLYKRIKEIDPIREASHVVIDEAQDFGMMAYASLHYCLRNCTYTIMGDTSQNIHFGYGLNDWEELRKLILTGTYDAFGLLKKSYRNTVEISNFATEILRHGDFPIYPVEPIIRHGDQVRMEQCSDVREMLAETVKTVKDWENKGYETIAIVCRDEKETKKVALELSKHMQVIDGTVEGAEFGNGTMVLPVAYTKGLEFDAVLLFNPSEKNYPKEDGYVKLLYVAATRALHELVVVHRGSMTGLIADPVPEGKHMTELSAETLTKAKEFDRKIFTEKELEEQLRKEGVRDMAERKYIGPKRIALKPEQQPKQSEKPVLTKPKQISNGKPVIKQATIANSKTDIMLSRKTSIKPTAKETPIGQIQRPINPSPYAFWDMPTEASELKPMGHGKVDSAVRWIKKEKQYVEVTSGYGILRITPLQADAVRIQCVKGQLEAIKDGYWKFKEDMSLSWGCKETRDAVEITTDVLLIRVEKRNGAVQFYKKDKTLLLQEKLSEPRQIESAMVWNYFDWDKREKLKAKGILATDLKDVTGKARYISFGGKELRMPLLLSDKGYGIAVPAEHTTLCCAIATYGPYIRTQGRNQGDYVFLYGGGQGNTISLYQKLCK